MVHLHQKNPIFFQFLKIFRPNIVTLQKHSKLPTKLFISKQHTDTSIETVTSVFFNQRGHDALFLKRISVNVSEFESSPVVFSPKLAENYYTPEKKDAFQLL